MKKLILIGITGLATLLAGAVAHLAGATPGTGVLGAPILARATLGVDVLVQMQTDTATELRWRDRAWTRNDLPEFLKALRDQGGVEDLGAWVGDHPAAAAKLGLPATRKVAAPDFAVQQVTLAPGGATGWHTHPGPAYVLVRSGSSRSTTAPTPPAGPPCTPPARASSTPGSGTCTSAGTRARRTSTSTSSTSRRRPPTRRFG